METDDDDASPFRGPGFFGLVDMVLAITMSFVVLSSLTVLDLKMLNGSLLSRLGKVEAEQSGVTLNEKRIIIPNELDGRIFFDSGSAIIRSDFFSVLEEHVVSVEQGLRFNGFNYVQIEGHTDNLPLRARAPFRDNWELGAARAVAVLRYLQSRGLPAEALSAVTYGDGRPKGSNFTEEGRRKNRRIELVLLRDLRGGNEVDH